MTAPVNPSANPSSWWNPNFSNSDWATIIQGGAQGASQGFQSAAQYANTKDEAKEAKRRTLSELLKNSIKRDLSLFKAGTGHQNEMTDFQSQALQQIARGFVDSLRGATVTGR